MIKEALKPSILKPYVEPPKEEIKVDEELLNSMVDTINKAIQNNIDNLSQNKYTLTKIKAIYPEANVAMDLFRKQGWVIGYTFNEPSNSLDISIKKLSKFEKV